MNMLWRGKVHISGNLSKQPFSRGSGRITLKTAYENIFIPENPQILGCITASSFMDTKPSKSRQISFIAFHLLNFINQEWKHLSS